MGLDGSGAPEEGDVYDVVFPDGMHAAAIVLRVFDNSAVFGMLDYYGDAPAGLESDGLRRLYRMRRAGFSGWNLVLHCSLDEPEGAYLGRVDGLEEDYEVVERGDNLGRFRHMMGGGAYWDRLRRSDPERAEAEWKKRIEALRQQDLARRRARAAKKGPGRLMNDDRFWALLGPGDDWFEDPEGAADACVERLAACTAKQILLFEKTLTYRLFQLDTKAHAETFAGRGYLSPDAFLYARCGVVASGSSTFERVLANPSEFPRELDLEELLDVARRAYEAVTGEDLEPTWELSYETGSNVVGWDA